MGTDLVCGFASGLSMMTIVLDDSRVQVQRLDALNTITHQISDSREFEPTVGTILEELTKNHARQSGMVPHAVEGDKLELAVTPRALTGLCRKSCND